MSGNRVQTVLNDDQRAELDKVIGAGRELLRDILDQCPGVGVPPCWGWAHRGMLGEVLGQLLESSASVFVVTSM